ERCRQVPRQRHGMPVSMRCELGHFDGCEVRAQRLRCASQRVRYCAAGEGGGTAGCGAGAGFGSIMRLA
ncbi:MAG: hypothetical protein AAFV27_06140, partial [Pseudomonadota bacterium]